MKRTAICQILITFIIFFCVLASVAFAAQTPEAWPMFHADLSHTGYSASSAPKSNQTLWAFNTGGQMGSPTVVDGVVFVGSYDHKIYAFNASNGAVIWSYLTGGIVISQPAVVAGVVYVGSEDHNLYALRVQDGTKIWNYTTGYYVDCDPLVANGVVYFGSEDNHIYALNADTGAYIWSYQTGDKIMLSSPALCDGVLFIGSQDGNSTR
ncbi:MAG: PQQ-binding-like beta-propeller repeat protein [Candidatus Bathyarchaeota archaeon]|nr:PQQ-binding-like beta-propeller repeat protein [Candidatus Bathyarchaeota archaeon]